jgi:hypothetical protein
LIYLVSIYVFTRSGDLSSAGPESAVSPAPPTNCCKTRGRSSTYHANVSEMHKNPATCRAPRVFSREFSHVARNQPPRLAPPRHFPLACVVKASSDPANHSSSLVFLFDARGSGLCLRWSPVNVLSAPFTWPTLVRPAAIKSSSAVPRTMEARRIFRLDNNRKPYAKIEIRARSLRTNNEEVARLCRRNIAVHC